jgi:hypothetical protein
VEVDLREVGPEQDFAAREEHLETAFLRDLVEEAEKAGGAELPGPGLLLVGRLVDVAVDAGEVAAERGLDRPVQRKPAGEGPRLLEELAVGDLGDGGGAQSASSRD